MRNANESTLNRLVRSAIGEAAAERVLATLRIDPALLEDEEEVSREVLAMALAALLFADLLERVPSAAAYVERKRAAGHTVDLDHGALRTIRFAAGPTGELPAGVDAFARILEPLGYRRAGTYPLPRLGMTGRAYLHRDLPEAIPQFFVSELHVDRFGGDFARTASQVFGSSRDPLDAGTKQALIDLSLIGIAEFEEAAAALPVIARAFGRHHAAPRERDYERLRSASAEAAWIATEGNAFNHAADRVGDLESLAAQLRAEGWRIKPHVEISGNGRVRQTALRADPIERIFAGDDKPVRRMVPGSFFEFVARDGDPATGSLDLSFDSGNATGIFAMTRAA